MQLELLHFLHPLQPLLCSNLNHCTFSDSSSLDFLPRKPLHFQQLYTNAFPANPNRCLCSHSESLTFQPLIRAEPILDLALSSRWSGFGASTPRGTPLKYSSFFFNLLVPERNEPKCFSKEQ
jgi:hypothetical protein